MARVFCALLLLLALRWGPGRAGEFCHGWAGSPQRWHRGFQCPERYDGPQATLCCGTCTLRYCCSAREARLDQGRCPGDHQQPSPRPPVPGHSKRAASKRAPSIIWLWVDPSELKAGQECRTAVPALNRLFPGAVSVFVEQSEVVDSAAVGRDAMGEWIHLENKEAAMKQDKSDIQTHAEMTGLVAEELDALHSFCSMKISRMHQQGTGGKSRKLQHGLTAEKLQTSDLNCIVPDHLMNRIHLKNIRETLKQVTEAEIHDSSVCPDCQKKEAELAQVAFLRRKKVLMESALTQEKLEEQIYSRDGLTLLGEALRSLPKPSEDPRNLWQRLKALRFLGGREEVVRHLALFQELQEGQSWVNV
ncbi:uncharacterized protein C8orf48 homolog [Apus apus]|uniref:uncharacterized protein C8orf48 homolog n=1 Tax=Apus apus TaxID=8895 RepID=UPI0021F8ACD8|nr:uncharacterized protein C8orf48 homolog [Apus apus]